MRRFKLGQRVNVRAVIPRPHEDPQPITPASGRAYRPLSRDDSAWIRLDARLDDALHPFPADDESGRGLDVLAWPEDCDEIKPVTYRRSLRRETGAR